MLSEPLSEAGDTLTLDELTERVGMSVRNIRFYTSKGLVPPPIRQGRSGYYTVDHVVRLELMAELQAHGFTLAAIEKYLSRIPADASPETIALHRTLLAPWSSDSAEMMSREELDRRAGRPLSEDDLRALEEMAVLAPGPEGCYQVNSTYLSIGVGLLDLGFPIEAAKATREIYLAHGRAIAEELTEVFRTKVKPVLEETGASPDDMREVLEKIKPLSIASLVAAYEAAVDDMRREAIARRLS